MKELKLQVNFAFYCMVCFIAFSIYIISLQFSETTLSILFKGQMALALLVMFVAALHLVLAITGQTHVLFCNNGLSYMNIFGHRKYIPSEMIHNVKIQSTIGVKVTKVSTESSTLYLLGFKPDNDQKFKLKQLGYLA